MRNDWTILCAGVVAPASGSIDLMNVVPALTVAEGYRRSPIDRVLPLAAPLWLVSQWSAEFQADRGVHPARLQLMAPGGEVVLNQDMLEFDLRYTVVYRLIHRIDAIRFVGLGTYEFHILVADFANRGEWGRACIRLT